MQSPTQALRAYLGTDKVRSYKKSDMDLREDLSLDGETERNFLRERKIKLSRKQQRFLLKFGVKQCSTCLLVLPFDCFPKQTGSYHGRSSCRDCHKYINNCYTEEKMRERKSFSRKKKEDRKARKRELYSLNKEYYQTYYKEKKKRDFIRKQKEKNKYPDL